MKKDFQFFQLVKHVKVNIGTGMKVTAVEAVNLAGATLSIRWDYVRHMVVIALEHPTLELIGSVTYEPTRLTRAKAALHKIFKKISQQTGKIARQ